MIGSEITQSSVDVAVVILTFNQKAVTLRCLESLMPELHDLVKVLVWDNGSGDGTLDHVSRAFPGATVHRHFTNLGVASGRNEAAKLAIGSCNPKFLLFLDNDMIVEPGFVGALMRPLVENERVGQTQAKLRFMEDRQRLNDGGGCQIDFATGRTRPVGFGEVDRGQYDTARPCVACGGAMMVRRALFERLGGFDPAFDPFGPEDLDFSLRLSREGYVALFVPDAVAYHAVSHTFGANYDANYARHKTRHWFLLMKRHASVWQRVVFTYVVAPFLFARVMVRETARGNYGVFMGLVRGALDAVRPQRS